MDPPDFVPLVDSLEDNIDDLEDALQPLMMTTLSEMASKLPLMDKAQLYLLVTYAIESLLFSYLRLSGVNAKEHSIFRELGRVKQYFEKANVAETTAKKPGTKIDKEAANRFIKHALSQSSLPSDKPISNQKLYFSEEKQSHGDNGKFEEQILESKHYTRDNSAQTQHEHRKRRRRNDGKTIGKT